MLIRSDRHSSEDLDAWAVEEEVDEIHAQSVRFKKRVHQASVAIEKFVASGPCYAGVSWGKDSTVLAGLLVGTRVPLVWVRVEPVKNPDCELVRDAFLRAHDVDYHEIEVWCREDVDGWHASGTLEAGFAEACKRFGSRHLSGIRGDESGVRALRMRMFGVDTQNTCAPIGWWSGRDVFAFLHYRKLPVHPAYACSMGGFIERERLRVASLGGQRGTGHGRAEWENRYYPEGRRLAEKRH